MAKLEEDITIKEQLVAELERSEKKIAKIRREYERKIIALSERISATELERDRVISQMNHEDKIRSVRQQYEKRITELKQEFQRLQSAEKQNKKMQAQQERQKTELQKLQNDLSEMKRIKVRK